MTQIVHLTTAHPVKDNRIFRKECAALVEEGFNVTLVAVHPTTEVIDGVVVSGLPARSGRFARMAIGPIDAWKSLQKIRPDVVHGHDPELIPVLVAYRLLNRKSRVIFDAHESLPKQIAGKTYIPAVARPAVGRIARGLEKLADKYLDGIVVATPHIAESFSNSNTTLVQNFPWLRDFPSPTRYPRYANETVMSYVGAVSKGRGSDVMSRLPSLTSNRTRLVVAGILAKDAEDDMLNGDDWGVDFRGKLSPEEIPPLIAASNVGLCLLRPLPNYLESQATKMYEYMAAARPFVASNFPYWVSLFAEYDCGIFVDSVDSEAAANAVDELADNPERAAEMGRNGRRAIEENFSFENEAARLAKLVRTLIAA